jgi:hypothetical protein
MVQNVKLFIYDEDFRSMWLQSDNIRFFNVGITFLGMLSSSIYLRDDDSTMSEVDDEVQELVSNRGILECEGDVLRDLWTTKWVFLHNDNKIVVAEGICHRVKFDLVIGSNGPLGDTHVTIQILKSLNADEFLDN